MYEGYLTTDKSGNLYITNKGFLDDYCREHPNSRFVLKLEKVANKKSDRVTAYFYAEVLPKIIKGYSDLGVILNKKTILEELKMIIPVMCKSFVVDNEIVHDYRLFDELNYFEKLRAIEECIIFAAEDLYIAIEEPI